MKVGFLSDAHGHLEAFEKGLSVLEKVGAEEVYFLGDAVGYLPGAGVAESLIARRIPSLLGNHEHMLLSGNIPSGRDDMYRLAATRKYTSPEIRQAIAQWPRELYLTVDGRTLHLVHGSPADPTFGYVYPDTDLNSIESPAESVVFMGHTHHPFVRENANALFVNVGSVGLPRDSGDYGAACLFDANAGTATILRFDIREETRRALARCGSVASAVAKLFERRSETPIEGIFVD